jgi:regulator of replication initiation timing
MSHSNIESFIDSLNVSEIEKNSLINIGKLVEFIISDKLESLNKLEKRIEKIEKNIEKVNDNHAKLIEDNLKITQTNELFKAIDSTEIQKFHDEAKKTLEEVASPEPKLTQISYEEYFIERGIDKEYRLITNGNTKYISDLIRAMYTQAKLTGPEYTYDPSANDIEKRAFFARGFKFMCDNIDNPAVKNAAIVNKNIMIMYKKHIGSN